MDLIDKLKDRDWRLDNLYLILVDGVATPFVARPEQMAFRKSRHHRNFYPKARKLGISTEIVLENGDDCIWNPNFKAAIIDETEPASWEKLEIFRFAWKNGPNHPNPDIAALWVLIHKATELVTDNNGELEWSNGSSMQAGTSFTGRTPQRLHVSEYGPICDASLEKGRKIRRGSINAVLPRDIVDVETTMRGSRIGPCHDLFKLAKKSCGQALSPVDWRLHFASWLGHPDYILEGFAPTDAITTKYFAKLKEEHGIVVDPARQAWYERKKREQGEDMLQEFPTTVEECDMAVTIGAILPQMATVRAQGRVRNMNLEPHLPIYATFDCGADSLSGWLVQPSRRDILCYDWKGLEGGGSAGLANMVRQWEAEHGITISKIVMPHDADAKDRGSAKTFRSQVEESGIHSSRIIVVPRIPSVWTGIGWLRRQIPRMWFHSLCDKEGHGIDGETPSAITRLENYRRAVNKATNSLQEHPFKDGVCDHCADALRTFSEASEYGLIPTMASTQAKIHPLDRDEDDMPRRGAQSKFSFVGR